jgi:PEP-CTERM motif
MVNIKASAHRNSYRSNRRFGHVALAAAVMVLPAVAWAQTTNWTGDGNDASWSDVSNWDSGVPAGGSVANIVSSGTTVYSVNYDYSGLAVTLASLTLDLSGGTPAVANTLSISANDLTADDETIGDNGDGGVVQNGGVNAIDGSLYLGYNTGSTGSYTLGSTGALTINSGSAYVGYSGTGTVNQTGGTFSITSTITSNSLVVGENNGATGNYNLSGGLLTCNGFEFIGDGNTAYFNHSGGTNSMYVLELGYGTGSTGSYILGGTASLTVSNSEQIGGYGVGSVDQTGGTNTTRALNLGYYSIGPGYGIGTYTLSGGSITTLNLGLGGNNSTGIFIQTGGINSVNATFDPDHSLQVAAGVGSSGAYTLSGGLLTVGLDLYVGGTSDGAGGAGVLTVSGSGTLNVNGTITVFNTPGSGMTLNGGTTTANVLNLLGAYTQTAGSATFGQITGNGQAIITGGETQLNGNALASQLGGLTMSGSGTLDITNNSLTINYSGADPATTIRSYLISGYNANGNKWQGTGVTSSLAAADPSAFSVGYADGGNPIDAANTGVPAGEVEIMYTVAGDANLSGGVDLSDLVIIASDFGMTGADWAEGDVNYDGNVDLSDLVIVASNFGASLSSVQTSDFSGSFAAEWQLALAEVHGADVSVPEPASAAVLALAGLAVLGRRRRRMN